MFKKLFSFFNKVEYKLTDFTEVDAVVTRVTQNETGFYCYVKFVAIDGKEYESLLVNNANFPVGTVLRVRYVTNSGTFDFCELVSNNLN